MINFIKNILYVLMCILCSMFSYFKCMDHSYIQLLLPVYLNDTPSQQNIYYRNPHDQQINHHLQQRLRILLRAVYHIIEVRER